MLGGSEITTVLTREREREKGGERPCDKEAAGEMGCDERSRGQSGQRAKTVTKSWRRQGKKFFSAPLEGKQPCRQRDFSPVRPTSDPTLQAGKSISLSRRNPVCGRGHARPEAVQLLNRGTAFPSGAEQTVTVHFVYAEVDY